MSQTGFSTPAVAARRAIQRFHQLDSGRSSPRPLKCRPRPAGPAWSCARRWLRAAPLAWGLLLGCASNPPNPSAQARKGEPLDYSFGTVDGELISSGQHRGRVTVLLFVTTFDVLSQAGAKRLEDLYRSHAPRINALAVVLEAPQYVELARSFRDVLELSYPVALVEKQNLRSQGMLAAVQTVPAWVFLDSSGHVSFAGSGALSMTQLEEAVSAVEQ